MQRHKSLASLILLLLWFTPALLADNYVRSVRVSWVEGDVQVQRAGETDSQPVIPNMPIIEGMTFTTGNDGVLEIELEDGSTVRLTPESALRIPELVTSDEGARRSTFEAQRGTLYIDFKHHGSDELYFRFPGHDVRLARSVRLRAEVAASEAQIAVFDGEFDVRGPDESVKVKKEETISLGLGDDATFTLAKSIEPAPFDDWNHQVDAAEQQYTSASNNGNFWSNLFGSGYNGGNLNYYGQTFYVPAFGYVWQPYNLTAAPCTTGYWTWYPGWGWTFISASPWGWGPCNYGAWNFAPTYGWFWVPPPRHRHHLRADWCPTPRWNRVPAGFVAPVRPSGVPDGHAGGMRIVAQGNVPPNPRQLYRDDDRDPRRLLRPTAIHNSTLVGKGTTSTNATSTTSSNTSLGSNLIGGPASANAGTTFANNGPRSVRDLRRELGGGDAGPDGLPHVVKQGMLRRVPPQPMGSGNAVSKTSNGTASGAAAGGSVINSSGARRGGDDTRFHNQVGTTVINGSGNNSSPSNSSSTSRNDSHPAKSNNSGWGWHPANSGSSNNSGSSRSSGSGGSNHPSGGSSYHPSSGGGASHPSGGGGGGYHPSGGSSGGGGGGGRSGGSSSSSSSSGSHSGKH